MLLLAAEGLTDKEIAKHLNLSQRTIGTYWERMRLKLGPYSRTQLVARFLRVESEGGSESPNYRNLFATWEEGVWILSPQGETIYANRRIALIFGFGHEEFRDLDARELFRTATSTNIDEVVSESMKGSQNIEFRLVRQDGSAVWIRMSGSAVLDPKGRCSAVVLLLQDMTVQKRVKHTLDSCESTLAFLSEHSSDLIARFDADLCCLSLNPSFLRLIQVNAEDVVGRPINELANVFRPIEDWIINLRAALQRGETRTFTSVLDKVSLEMRTHLLPEPSPDFLPATIMSISTRWTAETPVSD